MVPASCTSSVCSQGRDTRAYSPMCGHYDLSEVRIRHSLGPSAPETIGLGQWAQAVLDAGALLWQHGRLACHKVAGILPGGEVLWSSCTAHARRSIGSGGSSGGTEGDTAGYSSMTATRARLTPSRSSTVRHVGGHWSVGNLG